MANHGYVTTRKHLKREQIEEDLKEICQRRFGGHIQVMDSSELDIIGGWGWVLGVPSLKPYYCFSVWLRTKRKMEFRHSGGDWCFWAQTCVVADELALKYGGRHSDDGVEGSWPPGNEYKTYKEWLLRVSPLVHPAADKLLREVYAKQYTDLPQIIRDIDTAAGGQP